MDGPPSENRRRLRRATRAAVAVVAIGAAVLLGAVDGTASGAVPVMTGAYTGTNSNGSPVRLDIFDPDTNPAHPLQLDYWNRFGMDTTGPFLQYGEDFDLVENDQGYTSCSNSYGGFALFTGPNTFAGTHSNTQGTWTLEGTVDAYGHASGTLSATLNSGVSGIPSVQCEETFALAHPDAIDPPDETSTTTTTLGATTTTTSNTTAPAAPPSGLQVIADATMFVPGQPATFTGSGFQPGESVTGTFYSDPIPMGTVTADATGRAVFSFTIPSNVAAGQHTVRLVGATSGTVELAVTVNQPLSPSLPATGDSHAPMLALAAVLVCIGAVLVRTRHRPGMV